MATITSANSVFKLNIPGLFPISQSLQGYATDDAFAAEAVDIAETMMGVDGKMSSGYTPFMTKMTIALQADSPSIFLFDTWIAAMKAAREVLPCNGAIFISGVSKAFTMTNGVLTNVKVLPDAKKVLQPQHYVITWESINASPV